MNLLGPDALDPEFHFDLFRGNPMYRFMYYRVKDIMTSKPITVDPETTLSETEAIFEAHTFNSLPVVGKKKQLLGVISKLDLLEAVRFKKKNQVPYYPAIARKTVSEVMTKSPDVVEPETPLLQVLEKMIITRNKSLPVVKEDRLVGIIAREEMLMAMRRSSEGTIPARLISPDIPGLIDPVHLQK